MNTFENTNSSPSTAYDELRVISSKNAKTLEILKPISEALELKDFILTKFPEVYVQFKRRYEKYQKIFRAESAEKQMPNPSEMKQ